MHNIPRTTQMINREQNMDVWTYGNSFWVFNSISACRNKACFSLAFHLRNSSTGLNFLLKSWGNIILWSLWVMCTWSARDFTWARSFRPLGQLSGELSLKNLMHVVKKQHIRNFQDLHYAKDSLSCLVSHLDMAYRTAWPLLGKVDACGHTLLFPHLGSLLPGCKETLHSHFPLNSLKLSDGPFATKWAACPLTLNLSFGVLWPVMQTHHWER